MKDLALNIVEKGVKQLLDEAKIPARMHLKVIEALHARVAEHKQDREGYLQTLQQAMAQLGTHAGDRQQFLRTLESYDNQIARLHTLPQIKGEQGNPGKDGANGKDGLHGRDGLDANEERLLARLAKKIRQPKDGQKGQDATFDKEALTKEIVDYIRKKKPLDISHINGAQSFIMNGVRYRVEELMHGGGNSSSSTTVYSETPSGLIDGSNKVYTTLHTITTVYTLAINGQFIHPSEYTASGAGFTMGTALPVELSGTSFTIIYS